VNGITNFCFLLVLSLISLPSVGKTVIAVVGKTKNDSFYEQSFKGCEAFAQQYSDLECIYDGPLDYQDARGQAIVINKLLDKKVDGILVSTTDSTHLATHALKRARELGVPIITFDSDLLAPEQYLRLAYVGTDNFDFGKALGEYAKKFAKKGENLVCIQSGHQSTPNLNQRIAGVRFALSGYSTERLNGINGWTEYERCPFFSLGKRSNALAQLDLVARKTKPPIFIAVAGFAQFNPYYFDHMQKYKRKITLGELVIISADTEQVQLDALAAGLSSVNIGQKPFEMGRKGAELMYRFITTKQRPEQDLYYLDYHYCDSRNVASCLKVN
jgi:ribose transport system substrate-binding protein